LAGNTSVARRSFGAAPAGTLALVSAAVADRRAAPGPV